MNDSIKKGMPEKLAAIEKATRTSGFSMASDYQTGALLRTLAATKPGGNLLEVGTGTGLSTCWFLDGMDPDARLETVDNDASVVEIARTHLGSDPRVNIFVQDGGEFIREREGREYDLIFADTWPGKYWDLEPALQLLRES